MGRLAFLITLPALVVAVVFAVANRQEAVVRLWPFRLELTLPVYLPVLGALGVGLLIGGLVGWVSNGRARQRMLLERQRADDLARQLELAKREAAAKAARPVEPTSKPRLIAGQNS